MRSADQTTPCDRHGNRESSLRRNDETMQIDDAPGMPSTDTTTAGHGHNNRFHCAVIAVETKDCSR